MKPLKFSVITVVFNDLEGLRKTRKSLEEQRFANWVHIIIDGGSTDGTKKYLKTLQSKNTIYVSEQDSGIYNAMNKGWKLSEPDSFVYFLNARDVFTNRNSLYEAKKAMTKNAQAHWGCATHEEINPDGSGWVCKLTSPPSIPNQLFAFGYRSHQAVIMKCWLINQLGGFDEKLRIAADWDLIVRALKFSQPAIWSHGLGRFELGGFSANRILEAHLELFILRKRHLTLGPFSRVLEAIWASIYLKELGYVNLIVKVKGFISTSSAFFRHFYSHFPTVYKAVDYFGWINSLLGRFGFRLIRLDRGKPNTQILRFFQVKFRILHKWAKFRRNYRLRVRRFVRSGLKIQDYS